MGLLLLFGVGGLAAAAAAADPRGVRFEGDGEGRRPIRARWDGVSGMSEMVSFAREGTRGRRAREKFRRR